MIANILPADHPDPRGGVGSGWSINPAFSEYGHVAYRIKWNHDCSNMVAIICPQALGIWSKGQNLTFREHGHVVLLHIN